MSTESSKREECRCLCHSEEMKLKLISSFEWCCTCKKIQLPSPAPHIELSKEYNQDKVQELLQRVITLENFIGQNYREDLNKLIHLIVNARSKIEKFFERIEKIEKFINNEHPNHWVMLRQRIEKLESLQKESDKLEKKESKKYYINIYQRAIDGIPIAGFRVRSSFDTAQGKIAEKLGKFIKTIEFTLDNENG